jgi:D-alanyl-D-alanine carboxypeptidase/D-alanyl-D-alanine-endopeptidase (penicillin-binding protein 4)
VTKFCYSGKIADGILNGDLYVQGGMDPLFTDNDLDSIVYAVKLKGIKKINGNIYCDLSAMDDLYWGNGWMWDDDPSPDAPYLSALNINENCVVAKVTGTKTGSSPVMSLIPSSGFFKMVNNAITSESDSINGLVIYRDWLNRTNSIIAEGNIRPGEEKIVKTNVSEPHSYFLSLLREKLNAAGISVSPVIGRGFLPAGCEKLLDYKRNIDTVIVKLNKISDNLSGEMLLRALAEKYYGKPASAKNGILLIDSLIVLCGFDPADYRLVDGSGVSHYNLVSAELVTSVLKYMYLNKQELFRKLYYSLPVAGVDGTLYKRMKETKAYNNVHAKTGTLSGVSCLAGYVTAANGSLIAFSIMIQNHVNNNSKAIYFQDQVCNILAGYR